MTKAKPATRRNIEARLDQLTLARASKRERGERMLKQAHSLLEESRLLQGTINSLKSALSDLED